MPYFLHVPLQTKLGKALWSVIVCLGFLAAGYLIHGSYSDWQETPIATTITTHSISNLAFPTITVCPPKDSVTPLYPDLIKAGNSSLTDEEKEQLKNAAARIFIELTHPEYIRAVIDAVNPSNIRQVYEGFQSFPQPYVDSGFTTKVWNTNGTLGTPRYGEDYDGDWYKTDQHYYIVLEFPDNIVEYVGNGSLVVEVEIATKEEEGWEEYVEYREGPKYKLYTEEKSWIEAESHCQDEGGHLASVLSQGDKEDLEAIAGLGTFWLGGTDEGENGKWRWSDGKPWEYTNWRWGDEERMGFHCLQSDIGYWYDKMCPMRINFICKFTRPPMRGNNQMTLEYTQMELTFPSFHVWYTYQVTHINILETNTMPGFRLSWRINNSVSAKEVIEMMPDTQPGEWEPLVGVPRYKEVNLIKAVALAGQTRHRNMAVEEIVGKAIIHFFVNPLSSNMCDGNRVMDTYISTILDNITTGITDEYMDISELDVTTGFRMYTVLTACTKMDTQKLFHYLNNIITTESSRTIIYATVNTIQSGKVTGSVNRAMLNEFYLALDKIFHFHLGKILLSLSSDSEIRVMIEKGWPYFTHYTQEIDQCLYDDSCQGLTDIVNDLGGMTLGNMYRYTKYIFRKLYRLHCQCPSPSHAG